ncbi:MAG: acetamidase/formamidase family protein [Firmicutes bacterium]|nr:acetamidase/formamidase family protein [Bacillota bacterium]
MLIISRENVIYAMSAQNKPVACIEPGTQLKFETWDALHGQMKTVDGGFDGLDWSRVNPATGPVYINGAEVGDVLSVKINKIDVADEGIVLCGKSMGVMGSVLQNSVIKIVPIKGNVAHYSDSIHLPLNKMVGVIGVAPKEGERPCRCL